MEVFMRQTRHGFTLVELLVVIGIIAILVGITVPIIAKVRENARILACASNQRQIYDAIKAFSVDHADLCPGASGSTTASPSPYNGVGQLISVNEAVPQDTLEKTSRSVLVNKRYLSKSSIFACPELSLNPTSGASFNGSAVYHYIFNPFFVGNTQHDANYLPQYVALAPFTTAGQSPFSIQRPKSPSRCVLIMEDGLTKDFSDEVINPYEATTALDATTRYSLLHASPVHGRRSHSVGDTYSYTRADLCNCTYVDGHTELVQVPTTYPLNDPRLYAVPSDDSGLNPL